METSITSTSSSLCPTCTIAHTNYNCNACGSRTMTCNGAGSVRCNAGAYQTSSRSCSACVANCAICETSASNCLACASGYYHQSNNACASSCALLVRDNVVSGLDCYSPCNGTQVLLNSQCFSSCPLGFTSTTKNNALVCQQVCNSDTYFYQGSCHSACISPLFPKTDNITLLKLCYLVSCPNNTALLPDGSCTPTLICPSGTVLNNSIPSLPTCDGICSTFYYYHNGTCISICEPPFFPYTDPISHNMVCILCEGNDGYAPDQTCVSTCLPPTINITLNGNIYCKGPCPIGQYYFNGTCLTSCMLPYHAWTDPDSHIPQCVICEGATSYILSDRSCVNGSCPLGLTLTIKDGLKYCLGVCQDVTQYLYRNNTCLDDCPPPFNPYYDISTHELKCKLCDGFQGSLPTMICIDSCPNNTRNVTRDGYIYCDPICPERYLYKNGSCGADCSYPFFWEYDYDMFNMLCLLCNGTEGLLPNDICIDICPPSTRNVTINNYTYCNPLCPPGEYFYKNESCLPYCSSPFKSFWDPDGFNQFCQICNGTDGILPNNTCIHSCPLYSINTTIYNMIYCKPWCPYGQYLQKNATCSLDCTSPYHAYYDQYGINVLCTVCNGSDLILPNNTCVTQCPPYYSTIVIWNTSYCFCRSPFFLYKDGTCSPTCEKYFNSTTSADNLTLYCDLCPQEKSFFPDLTCLNSSCPANFSLLSKYGETICNGSCNLGSYYFNSTCLTSCPNYSVPYTISSIHVFSCYFPVSVMAMTQFNDSSFLIKFNNTMLLTDLMQNPLSIVLEGSSIAPSFKIAQSSSNEWMVVITNMDSLTPGQLQFSFPGMMNAEENGIAMLVLQNFTMSIRYPIIENVVPQEMTDTVKGLSAGSMAAAAGSAAAVSSSLGFKMQISMVQYLMALLFLNVNYPHNLLQFLQIFKVARMQFIPNPFEVIVENFDKSEILTPKKFYENEFSAFLFDCIGNIVLIASVFLSIHIFGYLMLKFSSSSKLIKKFVPKIQSKLGIPAMIAFLIGFSVIINVSIALQLRYPDTNPIILVSCIFAGMMIIFQIYHLTKIFFIKRTLIKYFYKKFEILDYYEYIFMDVKSDAKGIPSPYLAIVLARDVVQFTLLVLLYHYPLLQILSQLMSSISLLIYLLIKMPYLLKVQNILDASREFLLGFIFIVVMAIHIEDNTNQSIKGLIVIILCCLIVGTQFFGGLVIVFLNIRTSCMDKRMKNSKRHTSNSFDKAYMGKKRILRSRTISIDKFRK